MLFFFCLINKSLLAIIIRTIFEELEKEVISTELIQLPDVHIKPCRITQGKDRLACIGKDNCVFKDDDFYEIFEKIKEADGLILGSPVYGVDIGVYALSFVRWFMSEKPDQILSQVHLAPSKVDEQAGILLMNSKQEMATIALTLHAKQPKRGMIAYDKGYIEIYEYPRACKAVITYTEDNHQEVIECGVTKDALYYEITDMEQTILTNENVMHLDFTYDVMDMMSQIRESWGLKYPEEM